MNNDNNNNQVIKTVNLLDARDLCISFQKKKNKDEI